jgi:hypothetical protein
MRRLTLSSSMRRIPSDTCLASEPVGWESKTWMTSNRNRSWTRTTTSGILRNRDASVMISRQLQSYSQAQGSEMDMDVDEGRPTARKVPFKRTFPLSQRRDERSHPDRRANNPNPQTEFVRLLRRRLPLHIITHPPPLLSSSSEHFPQTTINDRFLSTNSFQLNKTNISIKSLSLIRTDLPTMAVSNIMGSS